MPRGGTFAYLGESNTLAWGFTMAPHRLRALFFFFFLQFKKIFNGQKFKNLFIFRLLNFGENPLKNVDSLRKISTVLFIFRLLNFGENPLKNVTRFFFFFL